MKKRYEKPYVESVAISELYGILLGDSGEVAPGGAMGKENNGVWEDVDDNDDSLMEPVEPKDVWGNDEPSEP